ncbi:MAG TPA: TonB-dependent receptor, partial [Candidatus Binatia bacterium]|nr:TonB-dependent receptor [Candidatus Binatia bacterium]
PVSATTAFRVNLMAHRDDIVGRDVAEQQRLGFAPSISFGLGTRTRLTLSYLVQGEDNIPDYGIPYLPGNPGRPARVNRDSFYGFDHEDYERTLLNLGTARLDHRFNDIFSLRNTLRFSHNDREHEVTAPRFNAATPGFFNRNRPKRDLTETILSNQTDLTAKFDTLGLKHTLVSGVEFSRETLDRTNYAFTGVPQANASNPNPHDSTAGINQRVSARSDGKAFGFGIFSADQIKLNEYFDIVGGVRWDYFDTDFDNTDINAASVRTRSDLGRIDKMWSYRGGLIFHPTQSQSYYFSYATAFNPSAEAIQLTDDNVNTAPEKNETFEVGAKLEYFDGALNFQGAVFRIDKTNARVTDPITDVLVLEGEQRVQGFELGVAGRILPNLNVFAGYTFLDSEFRKSLDPDVEGNDLLNVPRHSATVWTTYDFLDKWQIGGGPTYVSSRYNNAANAARIPGHVLWDATLAYQLTKNFQFRLNGINLNNDLYYSNISGGHVVPGIGRTFIFSTSFKF